MLQSSTTCEKRSYVTIVSGLPRSGTSMMMRMLDEGGLHVMIDGVRTADEDNPRGYYEFEPVKKTAEDASWLEAAPGKVVKMVYRLLYDLPSTYQYRVIFMRRRMEEILASQKKMLERNSTDDGAVSDEQLAALFSKQIVDFQAWVAEQDHIEVLEVSYNDVMENPAAQIERINKFLDGTLDAPAMQQAAEPQLYRNRATS